MTKQRAWHRGGLGLFVWVVATELPHKHHQHRRQQFGPAAGFCIRSRITYISRKRLPATETMDTAYTTLQAREATFAGSKAKSRRTSSRSQKSAPKAAQKGGWPLSFPTPHDLAIAGFIYKPTSASPDNVQCFHCQTQLDGWEESDFPAYEHLTHSPNCAFAINICIRLRDGDPGRTEDDPLSDAMLDARRRTFANLWPLDVAAGYPSIEQVRWESTHLNLSSR
jgi:hypothetical protein